MRMFVWGGVASAGENDRQGVTSTDPSQIFVDHAILVQMVEATGDTDQLSSNECKIDH